MQPLEKFIEEISRLDFYDGKIVLTEKNLEILKNVYFQIHNNAIEMAIEALPKKPFEWNPKIIEIREALEKLKVLDL